MAPAEEPSELNSLGAAQAMLELDQPLQDGEWFSVLLAVESGQHARVIVEGSDRRPQPLTERRPLRPPAQIVIALGSRRLGHD
ncbi:MAG: hypothetical protein KGJ43_09065, partial [Acidobacteriota bacterium]|nr:hypothetical protein [Acidobacteriota bacterium]